MARAWVNGSLVDLATPAITVDDHGLLVGDGVFETLKVDAGVPFALGRHLRRLRRSAAVLDLGLPGDEVLREAVDELLRADEVVDARLRITITSGSGPLGSTPGDAPVTVVVATGPRPSWPATASVVTVPWRRNEHGALAGVKSTSYAENVVALRYAHERGADEALFANTAGHLCEGTGTNVFVVVDGRLLTPPLSSGCLPGITRELVCELVEVEEADLDLALLHDADEIFITSSTRDVHPVARLDGRRLAPGPVTAAARTAFAGLPKGDI